MGQLFKVAAVLLAIFGILSLARIAPAEEDKSGSLDQKFAMEAATCGMAEVKFGQMATEQAANPEVRKFGQRMMDDHGKANKELEAIAGKKGISLPKVLDKKHQAVFEELSGLKGAAFDNIYMKHMVKGHTEAVKLFENQAKNGKDAELTAFANKALPTVREHLDMARRIIDTAGR